jgi:hypothetical protein
MTKTLNIAPIARFYIENIAFVFAFLSVIPAGNLLLKEPV